MKRIVNIYPKIDSKTYDKYFTEDTFFLDIETTGFQASYQICYLIGCMFYKNNQYELVQYLAENEDDEPAMLEAFLNDISTYHTIITFNGDMFDLPFLKKRFEINHMVFHTELFHSIDLFKIAKKCKRVLQLPNYKQKTIEHFLRINREDQYNGGELISIYKQYAALFDPGKEKFLLLHNAEDVHYMLYLLDITEYLHIKDCTIESLTFSTTENDTEIYFEGNTDLNLPVSISLSANPMFCKLEKNKIQGTLHKTEGTFLYFFENYKDYIFVETEKIILPKLLGSTIPKEMKRQAKKEECFVKKQGLFIPAIQSKKQESLYPGKRLFRAEYKSKDFYLLADNDILNNQFLSSYIQNILSKL